AAGQSRSSAVPESGAGASAPVPLSDARCFVRIALFTLALLRGPHVPRARHHDLLCLSGGAALGCARAAHRLEYVSIEATRRRERLSPGWPGHLCPVVCRVIQNS